jgi:hypothetical protein
MLAALQSTPKRTCQPLDFLEAPFRHWSPEQLLTHFAERDPIHYLPVIDEAQVTPERLLGILENRFEFNNEPYRLAPAFDWKLNPSSDIEWLILLHKFYYAPGLGRAFRQTGDTRYRDKWVELTRAWIADVPLDFLPSDVAGRRIQNWIFAFHYFGGIAGPSGLSPEFLCEFLNSIRDQVEYLIGHLTPARNHRTLELYALFLAAVVFPELKGAGNWLKFAIEQLRDNMRTDLLADGVHCELSTDYHHIVLRNLLGVRRLASLNAIELPADMDAMMRKALDFSLYAHKPDGWIPSISDGDTACFLELLRQGHEFYGDENLLYVASQGAEGCPPRERSKTFASSGYSILRSGWGDGEEAYEDERYLFFDCAPLGAGNHGHLDLLNIEVAAFGRSLIVDPGRYTYDESGDINWRVLFRGTRYHNTVIVDGMNQTRYAPHVRKFKIQGPEPDREFRAAVHQADVDYLHGVAASHEYPVVHERKIVFVAPDYWVVCDLLRGGEEHRYELLFHLDPQAQGKTDIAIGPEGLQIDSPNLVLAQPCAPGTDARIEPGFVSPSYGIKHAAPVVNISRQVATTCFCTVIHPYKASRPDISVRWLPLTHHGKPVGLDIAAGVAVSINTARGLQTDEILFSHQPGTMVGYGNTSTASALLLRRLDGEGKLWSTFETGHDQTGAAGA